MKVRKTANFLLITIFSAFTLSLFSCSNYISGSLNSIIDDIGVAIPEEKDYPENDGVVLFESIDSELFWDKDYGPAARKKRRIIKKIFKNIDEYANISLSFSDWEELKLIEAQTIKPDGTKQTLEKKDFYTIMPDEGSGSSVSGDKIVKFTFPGMTKNSIIELYYETVEITQFSGDFWSLQNFEMPTLKSEYILQVPKSWVNPLVYGGGEMNWYAKPYNYNFTAKAEPIRTVGNYTRTNWVVDSIPAFEFEKKMPPINTCITHVRFISNEFKTWDDITDIYSERFFKKFVRTSKVKELADELVQYSPDEYEKINSIFNYVRKLRYFAVSLGNGGITPNEPEKIIERGYGDCKDKAMLMIALLKEAGISANPVLLLTRDRGVLDPTFPTPTFNHMIVKVNPSDGNSFYVDPTDRFSKLHELNWGDQGIPVFVLIQNGKAIASEIKPSESRSNALLSDIHITITDDMQAKINVTVTMTGQQENTSRYAFFDKKEKDIIEFIKQGYGGDLRDIEINDIKYTDPDDLDTPFEFSFSYTISEIVQKIGNDYMLDMNAFDVLPSVNWLSEKTRKFDIFNNFAYEDEVNYKLNYDKSKIKIKALPTTVYHPDEDYMYKRTFMPSDNGTITGKEIFASKSLLINKGRYQALKDYFSKVRKSANEKVVFEVVR